VMGEVSKPAPIVLAMETATLSVVSIPDDLRYQIYAGAVVPQGAIPFQQGLTPALIEKLPPGQYTVVVNSPPWPVSSKVVEVGPQSLSEVVLTLPSGTLHVKSLPEGASININGKDMGKAPIEVVVPIGRYDVGAEWKGRPARVRSVELGDDDSEDLSFDFTTSTSTRSKTKRVRRPVKESVFTKVGRSIQNLFTGGPKRR
jgi:PEGA domain